MKLFGRLGLYTLVSSLAVLAGSVLADHIHPPDGRVPTEWLGPQRMDADAAGIGRGISDMVLGRVSGGSLRLHAARGEKGTVIVVRDPECPVSLRYGARVAQLARLYTPRGYRFIVLYLNELVGQAALAADANRLSGPLLFASGGGFALARSLGVQSTGDVFVLDGSNRIAYRGAVDDQFGLGYTKSAPTRHFLRNALDAIAAGRPVQEPALTAPGCFIDSDPGNSPLFEALQEGGALS